MRRRVVAGGVAVGVVVTGGSVLAWTWDGGEAKAGSAVPLTTAVVSRGDLVDTEKVDGKLTYDGVRQVWTGASGVVTWAPEAGATVKRGGTLLKVAGKAVTLMYGGSPMYRTLRQGDSGNDVRDLERNLRALGYGGITVDDEFTSSTESAVREWQDDKGLDDTGMVGPDQVVFLGGAVRVREVAAPEGKRTAPGQPVLTVAGTRRLVHVDLDADKQDLARKGAKVTVELPGGKTVDGRITKVGSVAESTGTGPDKKTTVGVDISLGGAGTGRLDEAPVTVELESERREDVLSVPVEALLALREGGFGVEVVAADGARRLVPVRTGAFGGGRVEVTGAGIGAGAKVGVPAK
ncbi:peptidoglycan-binding protein [Actinomadura decatromicini]|uniref:HlyD family efflux transporter periplasmic adaptor subunit n=1 Tax=Actinomadura decatromicini TaxID=2604572 RepID=A0A5D3FCT4_9ACTN|nr:peptidoglycan-binding protein [Actinomadura decatromicini]TYK45983.1 HlyD family efflux transporter periplasmic adaptor subunit [Actinomadura decatromicini]